VLLLLLLQGISFTLKASMSSQSQRGTSPLLYSFTRCSRWPTWQQQQQHSTQPQAHHPQHTPAEPTPSSTWGIFVCQTAQTGASATVWSASMHCKHGYRFAAISGASLHLTTQDAPAGMP
jgi:hypothetical protein